MKERSARPALAALTLLCAGQFLYIISTRPLQAQQNEPPPAAGAGQASTAAAGSYDDPWQALENWRRGVHGRLRAGLPPGPADFDRFFDDAFFSRRFSAFDQMDSIHRQLMQAFGGADGDIFGGSWDAWRQDRLGMRDFQVETSREGADTVMSITVPGLDSKNAEIDVNRDRVRLAFTARRTGIKREKGAESRSESVQSYLKVLPVPAGTDGEKARVELEGDRIRITFPPEAGAQPPPARQSEAAI